MSGNAEDLYTREELAKIMAAKRAAQDARDIQREKQAYVDANVSPTRELNRHERRKLAKFRRGA